MDASWCLGYAYHLFQSTATAAVMAAVLRINPAMPHVDAREFVQAVAVEACVYDVAPADVLAIAEVETHFRPRLSMDGVSTGIMQVNYPAWFGIMPPAIWADRTLGGNVEAAVWIMNYWQARCDLKTGSAWWRHYPGGYLVNSKGVEVWEKRFKIARKRWERLLGND